MMKVVDGFLVRKVESSHEGEELANDILGVELKEWAATERIERESEYYADSPFEYSRSAIKNGLVYMRNSNDEQVHFVYEKCIIITGV